MLNHPAVWHDARGRTVYSAEPLEPVDGRELASFVADCTTIGAYVVVMARSGSERSVLLEVGDASHTPFRRHRA